MADFLVPASLPLSGSELYGGLFWTVYLVWLGSETFVLSRRRAAGDARVADAGSRRVLRVSTALAILSCFTCAVRVPSGAFAFARRDLFFAGVMLMAAGLVLRWWAVRVLGRLFTTDVAIHAGQTVIEHGPYRWIRHPAYAGLLLTLSGIGLALGNWLGLLVLLGVVSAALAIRIRIEEAALLDALGEPYRAYMRRTRRLLPLLI